MGTVQASVTRDPIVGVAGMAATSDEYKASPYTNGGTTGIGFGVAVKRNGNTESEAVVGVAGGGSAPFAATEYLGVTMYSNREPIGIGYDNMYAPNASMDVMREGDMWAVTSEAVVPGDPVAAADGTGVLGKTASATAALIPDAVWMTAAAANGLAIVRLGTDQVG